MGSVQLGADAAVSVGPLGRSLEADVGLSANSVSGIYTYSLSKGLYAGISLDGKILFIRSDVNRNFYGMNVRAKALLDGEIPTPPAAQPLYDALKRCQFYATSANNHNTKGITNGCIPQQHHHHRQQRPVMTGAIPSNVDYSNDYDEHIVLLLLLQVQIIIICYMMMVKMIIFVKDNIFRKHKQSKNSMCQLVNAKNTLHHFL